MWLNHNTHTSYPGQAKKSGFSCILVKLILTFLLRSIPISPLATVQTIRRTLSITETSWLYVSSEEEHCADGLKFGLFVLADHYLLCQLFTPCVYPGVIFERAAVVQQCNAQWAHSRGKSLLSVGWWKSCPCSSAAGLSAAPLSVPRAVLVPHTGMFSVALVTLTAVCWYSDLSARRTESFSPRKIDRNRV